MKYRVRNKQTMKFVSVETIHHKAWELCHKLNANNCSAELYEVVPMNAEELGISKSDRPMTADEREAINSLNGITGSSEHKRFSRNMNEWIINGGTTITDAQAAYLWYLIYHYRRQIKDTRIIKLAEVNKVY